MDLSPPPHFRHRHHHHIRYGNVLHPPDFVPRDLPPPPPPPPPPSRTPHILLPPPPPPPSRRQIANPPVHPHFTFSPPHRPIPERSRLYEFDPPKPYSRPNLLPPPPPPPLPRENIPLRLIHEYPERNPIFRDEIFHHGCLDSYACEIPENLDQDSHWIERERLARVADMRDGQGYRNSFHQNGEFYYKRDDEERRWGNGINDWDRDFYSERDYEERRVDSVIDFRGREFYNERDFDERRCRNEANDRGSEFYNERDYAERRLDSGFYVWDSELCSERGFDERTMENGTNDVRRRDRGSKDDVFLRLGNRLPEFVEDDSKLDRFSGRLGRGVSSKEEFNHSKKKRRLDKNSASHRILFGKDCTRHSGGHKSEHSSKKSNSDSFRGKENEWVEWSQARMEDKREREQSPMELAISFKSNAMVAKAIMAPSPPAAKLDLNSTHVKNRSVDTVSGSPMVESSNDVVKTAISTCGLDLQSDPQRTTKELQDKEVVSANRSTVAADDNELAEIARNNEPAKDMKLQGPTGRAARRRAYKLRKKQRAGQQLFLENNLQMEKGSGTNDANDLGENAVKNEPNVKSVGTCPHKLKKKRKAGKQLLPETNPQMKKDSGDINIPKGCTSSSSAARHLNSDAAPAKGKLASIIVSVVPDTSLLPSYDDYEEGEIIDDSYEIFVPNLKRKRSSSTTTSASSSECTGRAEKLVIAAEEADRVCQLRTDVASCHAHQTFSADDSNNADIHNKAPVLGTEKSPIECIDQNTGLSADGIDDISKNPLPESNESNISSDPDIALLQKPVNVAISDMVSTDAKPKEFFPYQVNTSQVGVDAGDFQCLEGAAFADGSNIILGTSTSSHFPAADRKGTIDVDFGADGSLPGYRKKIKVVSPVSNLSGPLEDDMVVDGLTLISDCSKLDQGHNRLADWEAEQRKGTSPASAAMIKCGTTDMECKFGSNLNENYASNSGDELLMSEFDMPSCMSSPEELLSYSNLSFSRNNKASTFLSEKEMIPAEDIISNKKPAVSNPNTLSLGRSLKKAPSDNSQSIVDIPPSISEDKGKVVRELNLARGKLALSKNPLNSAVPKAFPGHHSLSFSNSRKFPSSHVTNSRTWHRTGNSSVTVAEPKLQSPPLPQSHGTMAARTTQSSYVRKWNSLVRTPSPSGVASPGFHGSSSSVYRLTPSTDNLKGIQASNSKTGNVHVPKLLRTKQVNPTEMPKVLLLNNNGKSLNCTTSNLQDPLPVGNPPENGCPSKALDALGESTKSSVNPECQTSTVEEGNLEKKIKYVKRKSNQLVAASISDDKSMSRVDKTQGSSSDGYYKSRKNQLVRASSENHVEKRDGNINSCKLVSHAILPKTSTRRLAGSAKITRYSKLSFVWKLHDTQSSEKHKNLVGPQKVWPHLFPWKRVTYRRSFMHALGAKANSISFSTASQKLLLSRKRGAVYTRSTHGYSLKISKVLSVSGSSLKWSKSIEKNSKKVNEEATRAVAAAQKSKKEEKDAAPIALKSRNHVSRERIFRVGSERYKMDPTRRTLHRITAEQEPSSLVVLPSEKNVKKSYVPRRLLIGNEEYVRIGNGNQLVRDPKKRTRVLASEKVRWSLRTARLRLARKRKYCQFFTRYGKCNKDDGKCPYIHDPSKIAVCTKFLNGSCSNLDCQLTHKVIPERMQDCSYFLKGSCSNENCPYRHVNVDPDSTVCESFLRGYCADGNECQKKHTYVCPSFEATGTCPQPSMCKLHHPKKKKTESKPTIEQQKIVRGRYFDGGLIGDNADVATTEKKLSTIGKDDVVICREGKYPDFISLDVGDDEEMGPMDENCEDILLPDAQIEM